LLWGGQDPKFCYGRRTFHFINGRIIISHRRFYSMKLEAEKYIQYFRKPFPGASGFSAYRFPGLLVHIPVFLAISFIGFYLNFDDPWTRAFILFYFFLGLYLGRDIAVYAHYNPLIIAAVAAILIFFPSLFNMTLKPLKSILGGWFTLFSVIADLVIIFEFVLYVHRWAKKETE
jgi:hypothetical protein